MSEPSQLFPDTDVDEKISLLDAKVQTLELLIKWKDTHPPPMWKMMNPRAKAFAQQKDAPNSISTLRLPAIEDIPLSKSESHNQVSPWKTSPPNRHETNLADISNHKSSGSDTTVSSNSFSARSSLAPGAFRSSFSPPSLTRQSGRPQLIRRPSVIEEQLHDSDHYKDLSQDTFTLMMLARPCSKQWIFGVLVFTLQATLLTMVISEQYTSSRGSTPFDVPYKVPPIVHIGQLLAIILSLATQTDLVISIVTFITLWFHRRTYWTQLLKVPQNSSVFIWLSRIAFPIGCEFLEGLLVLIATFVIVIQSESIIELFKDFAAMQLISELDNMSFWLALHGYLGSDLAHDAKQARKIKIHEVYITTYLGIPLRSVVLLLLFISMGGGWGYFVHGQLSGNFFYKKYPYCSIQPEDIIMMRDGICDGGVMNTIECGFDDGDCISFNFGYPSCFADAPSKIGDGICDPENNTPECRYDGNDCCPYLDHEYYHDGFCHGGQFNSFACGYDGGDCVEFNYQLVGCKVLNESYINLPSAAYQLPALGDGICDGGDFNSPECKHDGGDCNECNQILLNANLNISKLGDGVCDSGLYMIEPCYYDGGDCLMFAFFYPGCIVDDINLMQNGVCNGGSYFTEECDFDGGDCDNCTVTHPEWVGDGFCDGGNYASPECSYDGLDCSFCSTEHLDLIGNGICDLRFNTSDCGFDGGDCLDPISYRLAKYGFIIESEAPSMQPLPMPSQLPTIFPSDKPTQSPLNYPTQSPTRRPTASPSISHAPAYSSPPTQCADITDIFHIPVIDSMQSCEWVSSGFTEERCSFESVSEKCPQTCGLCGVPTASPTIECHDLYPRWHDIDGETYDCLYYSIGDNCQLYGHLFANPEFENTSANEACCVCGGGFKGSFPPSTKPTKSPVIPPTAEPTASNCFDSTSSFFIPTIGLTKDCNWVGAASTLQRCSWKPVGKECPRTCSTCGIDFDDDDEADESDD